MLYCTLLFQLPDWYIHAFPIVQAKISFYHILDVDEGSDWRPRLATETVVF